MAQNTKTPAMVLQEFTVKNSLSPPEYILEHCKTGTHENEFHYRVVVANVTARGFGRSKQVAKHDAAIRALDILAENGQYDRASNPVQTFQAQAHRNESDNPFEAPVNSIGVLKEKCTEQKLSYPIFTEISDVGPPHCRIFTYECTISSLRTQATANTKKQAKQLAAKEMLEKVRDLYPDASEPPTNALPSPHQEEQQRVIKHYRDLQIEDIIPNRAANINDFSLTIKKIMVEKEVKFADIKHLFADKTEKNLEAILKTVDLKYHIYRSQPTPTAIMLSLSILIDTPFTIIAMGDQLADVERNLFEEAFPVLEVFMK